jgi:tetratricopeptide (TPR) repeat protein
MNKLWLIVIVNILAIPALQAQKEYRLVRKGNAAFEKEKFNDAEILFRKALEKNKSSIPARYNLGNALYKEKNYQEAASTWGGLSTRADLKPEQQAALWHNSGNAFLQAKNYQAAIEAYKQALKINPADDDTRYNLSYALFKARQQEQQQKQNQNQQQQNKNQQQQQNQQNQQTQQPHNQQQNEQPQQAQPQELSKQDAERMLEAMKNAEQKTMEKLKQEKKPMVSGRPVKDW